MYQTSKPRNLKRSTCFHYLSVMLSHIYTYQRTGREFRLDQIPMSLHQLSEIAERVISLWTPLTSKLFEETRVHLLSLKSCTWGSSPWQPHTSTQVLSGWITSLWSIYGWCGGHVVNVMLMLTWCVLVWLLHYDHENTVSNWTIIQFSCFALCSSRSKADIWHFKLWMAIRLCIKCFRMPSDYFLLGVWEGELG